MGLCPVGAAAHCQSGKRKRAGAGRLATLCSSSGDPQERTAQGIPRTEPAHGRCQPAPPRPRLGFLSLSSDIPALRLDLGSRQCGGAEWPALRPRGASPPRVARERQFRRRGAGGELLGPRRPRQPGKEAKATGKPAGDFSRGTSPALRQCAPLSLPRTGMRADRKPERRLLLFLLLATLTVLGDASESSATGNCHCDNPISNLRTEQKEHLRKHLKGYQHCTLFVRFQLPSRTVCGSSTQSWVLELMSCFDHKECGHTLLRNRAHQKHLPPPSTCITETTAAELSDMTTSVLTLQSTQQPTFIASTRPLDKSLMHSKETSTPTVGHSLKVGPEAGENQKQLKENSGLLVPKTAIVAVPSLLALVFILTGILLCVLCRQRKAQSRQHCSDLQLQYEPVAPDPNV